MKEPFDLFFTLHGVVTLLTAVTFLFAPGVMLVLFGTPANPAINLVTQLLGAAFLGIGGIALAAGRVGNAEFKRVVALVLLMASVIGFIVSVVGQFRGVTGPVGWGAVLIYGTLSVGYSVFVARD